MNGLSWPSHKTCLDQPPVSRIFGAGLTSTKKTCRDARKEVRAIPAGYEINSTCAAKGGDVETHAQLTGNLETIYVLQTTMRANSKELSARETGEWLGICPAGVKSGEWVDRAHPNAVTSGSGGSAPSN
jgi:hypothetical protein